MVRESVGVMDEGIMVQDDEARVANFVIVVLITYFC